VAYHDRSIDRDQNSEQRSIDPRAADVVECKQESDSCPDVAWLAAELAKWPAFKRLDAQRFAEGHAHHLTTGGKRRPWVAAAVRECAERAAAADSVPTGSWPTTKLADQLSRFIGQARPPRDDEPPSYSGHRPAQHDDPDDWRNDPAFKAQLQRRGRKMTTTEQAEAMKIAPPPNAPRGKHPTPGPAPPGRSGGDLPIAELLKQDTPGPGGEWLGSILKKAPDRSTGPTQLAELVTPAEPGNGRSAMTLEEATEAAREAQRKAEELRVDQGKRCDSCGAVGHTAAEHELFERELAEATAEEAGA
jgi:hypothetical protein